MNASATPDPAAAYAVLRTETAAMLKLNSSDLSLVEGLQLDLVSLVRLEVDMLQGRALANEPIDLDRLSTALGMLQKLLPAQALVSTPPPSETTRCRVALPAPRLLFELAARHRLPTVCEDNSFTVDGGLMSYGWDYRELIGQGARYIDRILRGARPKDLPVEQVSKFELVINLKTAKAIGVTVPEALLVRADKVIE
jgi:hypothetical protein